LAGQFKVFGNSDAVIFIKIGALCEVSMFLSVSDYRHAAGLL